MAKPDGLAILLGGAKPPGEEPEEDIDSEAKVSAAKDALRAFKRGDAPALSDALERHYQACSASDYDDDDDDDEGEEL